MGRAADTLRRMSHSVLLRSRRVLRKHLMALSLVISVGQNLLYTLPVGLSLPFTDLCPQSWPEECYPGRALLVINW